jgi:ABC-type uncharacterized transport system permease subunit
MTASPRTRRATAHALPVLAAALALAVSAGLVLAAGHDPVAALDALRLGTVGHPSAMGDTITKVVPLLILGLGVAIGIRAGLWNLGGDGQMTLGGLGAAVVGLWVVGAWPSWAAVPVIVAAGFAAGALWGGIAGLLKARRGITEVITTLLMNFIAINLVTLAIERPPLLDPQAGRPQTKEIAARLGEIPPGPPAHAGLVIGLVLIVLTTLLLTRTSFGLEVRAVGQNARAARFAGIRAERRLAQVLMLSGGFAGIAGAVEVLGVHYRMISDLSPGYGFTAVAVALLAAADPRLILPSAVFFGALVSGGPVMQQVAGVPLDIVYATQGIVILFVITAFALRSRILRRLEVAEQPEAAA